jgi:hypothetical protein
MAFAQLVLRILYLASNHYVAPFAFSSPPYLVGFGIIQLVLPRLDSMKLDVAEPVPRE